MEFQGVKEVGEVEGKESEVICGVNRGVDLPQEPFIIIKKSLSDVGVGLKFIALITWSLKDRCGRDVNVVALVEFAFEVRQANHYCKVFPYVALSELKRFTDNCWSTELCTWNLSPSCSKNTFSLEAVEVFCKASAIGLEAVSFNS